jgi:TetR/AcrR family transcriptional regulator, transcriptional repressor of aconitase
VPKLTEHQKQERIERILEGARRCFAEYGYEGATVARLEHEIGLSRGAIFNWFPSKEALFFELASRDNERLLRRYADEGLDAIVREVIGEDADWLAVYLEFGRRLRTDAEFRERWKKRTPDDLEDRLRERVLAGQAAGTIRDDLDVDTIGRFTGIVLDGIVLQRALGFGTLDADTVVMLVDDAIGGRARRRRPRRTPS